MSVGGISGNSYESLAMSVILRVQDIAEQQGQTAINLIESAQLQVPTDPNNTIDVQA
jgi:hypothetical protein